MKILKKRYRFFLNIIIFAMIFIGLFSLQGCQILSLAAGKLSEVQNSDSAVQPDNSGAQGNNSSTGSGNADQEAAGAPDNSGSTSETQAGGADVSQKDSGVQGTDNKPVFLTYLDETGSFAFQYPSDIFTLSSNIFVAAGADNVRLSVMKQRPEGFNSSYYYFDKQKISEDIAALKEGKFGADIEYSYKPSQKVLNIDGRFLKDFVIFSRSDCDVCFERVMIFYQDEVQYLIVFQGDLNTFKESLTDYLVTGNKDCQGLPAWGEGKIDALYKELLNGNAPEKIQQWYDSFDDIAANLTFESSKIAAMKNNGNCTITGKSIYENMPKRKTEISASYPFFESSKSAGIFNDTNVYIKDLLDLWIAEFMQSASDTFKDMPADALWVFQQQADYAIEYFSGDILSLSFTDYTFTGGAHGSTISSTYNYNLVKNKEVSLGDIFKPGSDYLKFLSDYCYKDIKRQNTLMGMDSMDDMISPGVDPTIPENFARFLLTADSLIIKFDQYQVGPGAAGSYIVRIGYEKIKELMNDNIKMLLDIELIN